MNATTDTTPTAASTSTANRMGRNPFAKPAATETAAPKARVLKAEARTVSAEAPLTFSRVLRFLTVTLPVGSLAISLELLRERFGR